jgi:hypothetical protein
VKKKGDNDGKYINWIAVCGSFIWEYEDKWVEGE